MMESPTGSGVCTDVARTLLIFCAAILAVLVSACEEKAASRGDAARCDPTGVWKVQYDAPNTALDGGACTLASDSLHVETAPYFATTFEGYDGHHVCSSDAGLDDYRVSGGVSADGCDLSASRSTCDPPANGCEEVEFDLLIDGDAASGTGMVCRCGCLDPGCHNATITAVRMAP